MGKLILVAITIVSFNCHRSKVFDVHQCVQKVYNDSLVNKLHAKDTSLKIPVLVTIDTTERTFEIMVYAYSNKLHVPSRKTILSQDKLSDGRPVIHITGFKAPSTLGPIYNLHILSNDSIDKYNNTHVKDTLFRVYGIYAFRVSVNRQTNAIMAISRYFAVRDNSVMRLEYNERTNEKRIFRFDNSWF